MKSVVNDVLFCQSFSHLSALFFLCPFLGKNKADEVTVHATCRDGPERTLQVKYTDSKVIGNGSFGVVYQAKLVPSGELVAIKRVLQDKRFKNRELTIMKTLDHCNIVKLKYFFYTTGNNKVRFLHFIFIGIIFDSLMEFFCLTYVGATFKDIYF